jgi:hypothetical protein
MTAAPRPPSAAAGSEALAAAGARKVRATEVAAARERLAGKRALVRRARERASGAAGDAITFIA